MLRVVLRNLQMPCLDLMFKRTLDDSYPRVWDTWQSDGVTWVIQDLPPEDDDKAIRILVDNLCTDEVLCSLNGVTKDHESVRSMSEYWMHCLSQRMSLGCYAEERGDRKLVALNVCLVSCEGEEETVAIEGRTWKNVYAALDFAASKFNAFEYMGVDKLLYAMGLVVSREYRGARLGARILAAREPLSRSQGLKGTSTVFTGIASQKLAARCGFQTVAEVPIRELAEAGLDYPYDDERSMKFMMKKYQD